MHYFVKERMIHRYPTPKRCDAVYTQEQLRDTIPYGVEECVFCMRRWPEDEGFESNRSLGGT